MNVLHHQADGWDAPLLCVTHSARAVDLARCSREFLIERYRRPDRLPPATPFEQLTPSIDHSPFKGDVTVWSLRRLDRPELLAHLRPNAYKPQHAIWLNRRLWVLGVESLEVFDASLQLEATVIDPWLSGGHTVWPDGRGGLLLTCSASDAVLTLDMATRRVTEAWRLPEAVYGRNYDLTRAMSVVEHYIDNDRQLTHVNAAVPWRGGVLVSTLIQGAIGHRDADGRYVELTRGHVGCHGVRTDERGGIVFCDSCAGTLRSLSPDGCSQVMHDTSSRWLHDAQPLDGGVWAFAVADRNSVELIDLERGDTVATIDGSPFGQSTQFLWYGR
jgi:hypothetical protein